LSVLRVPIAHAAIRLMLASKKSRPASRVEVHSHAFRFRPIDPPLEVLRADLVALDFLAAELAVKGMQVEAMFAGDQ
jgi:hypothetical protein